MLALFFLQFADNYNERMHLALYDAMYNIILIIRNFSIQSLSQLTLIGIIHIRLLVASCENWKEEKKNGGEYYFSRDWNYVSLTFAYIILVPANPQCTLTIALNWNDIQMLEWYNQ